MSADSNPVILTYHSIARGRSPLKVSPSLFVEQMEWLEKNARIVPLAEMARALTRRQSLPANSVVLTFDDGFQDFYTDAAPLLRRLGFAATVFLTTAYCGRTNAWPGQPDWVERQALMNWKQIRELAEQGISFGAHTRTHPVLTEMDPAEAEGEIAGSGRDVESATRRPAEFFCYPYGRLNSAVRGLVMRHYRGACSTGVGVVEPDADPFALPRVDVHYLRRPARFRSLFTRRFRAYLATRRLVRRVRGQPEGFYQRV